MECERDELHASAVEMTHHAERRQVELDAARARIAELEAENERLRLHEQTVLAFVERAERGGEPLDPAKIRRVEGDRTDSAHREAFSWRYNPVVNQLTRRYHRTRGWAKIVHAAVLERPVVAGVSISGAQLSAVDGPVLVGRDTSIDQCTVTTQLRVVASSVRVTGCHFKGPDVDLSRVHVERGSYRA